MTFSPQRVTSGTRHGELRWHDHWAPQASVIFVFSVRETNSPARGVIDATAFVRVMPCMGAAINERSLGIGVSPRPFVG